MYPLNSPFVYKEKEREIAKEERGDGYEDEENRREKKRQWKN